MVAIGQISYYHRGNYREVEALGKDVSPSARESIFTDVLKKKKKVCLALSRGINIEKG